MRLAKCARPRPAYSQIPEVGEDRKITDRKMKKKPLQPKSLPCMAFAWQSGNIFLSVIFLSSFSPPKPLPWLHLLMILPPMILPVSVEPLQDSNARNGAFTL